MQKFGLMIIAFCGVVFCASTSFAQLSANPWVEANTKEQVDEVYDKYQRRGYHATDVKYSGETEFIIEQTKERIKELNEQEEKKPSLLDKVANSFSDDNNNVEDNNVSEQDTSSTETMSLPSLVLREKVNQVKNSFKLPSFNANNMIRKFERSIGVDFKAMARKLK